MSIPVPSHQEGHEESSSPIKARMIDQFLQNQSRELDLRTQELDMQRQSGDQAHHYAIESLAVQERVLQAELSSNRQQRRDWFILIGACVLVVAGFLAFAVWKDKDQVVMEIFKALMYVVVGGGGYAIGHRRQAPRSPPTQDDPED
jgi:hypothetical protein